MTCLGDSTPQHLPVSNSCDSAACSPFCQDQGGVDASFRHRQRASAPLDMSPTAVRSSSTSSSASLETCGDAAPGGSPCPRGPDHAPHHRAAWPPAACQQHRSLDERERPRHVCSNHSLASLAVRDGALSSAMLVNGPDEPADGPSSFSLNDVSKEQCLLDAFGWPAVRSDASQRSALVSEEQSTVQPRSDTSSSDGHAHMHLPCHHSQPVPSSYRASLDYSPLRPPDAARSVDHSVLSSSYPPPSSSFGTSRQANRGVMCSSFTFDSGLDRRPVPRTAAGAAAAGKQPTAGPARAGSGFLDPSAHGRGGAGPSGSLGSSDGDGDGTTFHPAGSNRSRSAFAAHVLANLPGRPWLLLISSAPIAVAAFLIQLAYCGFLYNHALLTLPPLRSDAHTDPHMAWLFLHLLALASNLIVTYFDAIRSYDGADDAAAPACGMHVTYDPSRASCVAATAPRVAALLLALWSRFLSSSGAPHQLAALTVGIALCAEGAVGLVAAACNTYWALSTLPISSTDLLPDALTMRALPLSVAAVAVALLHAPLFAPSTGTVVLAACTVTCGLVFGMALFYRHLRTACRRLALMPHEVSLQMRFINKTLAISALSLVTVVAGPCLDALYQGRSSALLNLMFGLPIMAWPPGSALLPWAAMGARAIAVLLLPIILSRAVEAEQARQQNRALEVAVSARFALLGAELEELAALKERVLLTVTHELNTPLHAVLGCLDALVSARGADSLTDASRPFAETAASSAAHAAHLVRSMLDAVDLSGAGASDGVHVDGAPAPAPIESGLVSVRHVLASLEALPMPRSRRLVVSVDPDVDTVWADADRLLQVLFELASNGFKNSDADVHVSVATAVAAGRATFTVQDFGTGIPAHELSRIWSPFHQIAAPDDEGGIARTEDGVGLGLYLVVLILRALGSAPRCSSIPGVGTTMSFDLPLSAPPAAPPPHAVASPCASPQRGGAAAAASTPRRLSSASQHAHLLQRRPYSFDMPRHPSKPLFDGAPVPPAPRSLFVSDRRVPVQSWGLPSAPASMRTSMDQSTRRQPSLPAPAPASSREPVSPTSLQRALLDVPPRYPGASPRVSPQSSGNDPPSPSPPGTAGLDEALVTTTSALRSASSHKAHLSPVPEITSSEALASVGRRSRGGGGGGCGTTNSNATSTAPRRSFQMSGSWQSCRTSSSSPGDLLNHPEVPCCDSFSADMLGSSLYSAHAHDSNGSSHPSTPKIGASQPGRMAGAYLSEPDAPGGHTPGDLPAECPTPPTWSKDGVSRRLPSQEMPAAWAAAVSAARRCLSAASEHAHAQPAGRTSEDILSTSSAVPSPRISLESMPSSSAAGGSHKVAEITPPTPPTASSDAAHSLTPLSAQHCPAGATKPAIARSDAALAAEALACSPPAHIDDVDDGRPLVLVVDDNVINQMVMQRMLTSAGLRVQRAMSGEEALSMLQHAAAAVRMPDLLILDVMMPRISGLQLCRDIRRIYPGHILPVIFVSANSRPEHIVDGLAAGAQDYMAKPVNRDELIARVSAQLKFRTMMECAAEKRAAQLTQRMDAQRLDTDRASALQSAPVAASVSAAGRTAAQLADSLSMQ